MTKYLHTMIRVSDPDATIAFFDLIGVKETRRFDNEQGRFTLIFLAAEGQEGVAEVELTYNWPAEDGSAPEDYTGGRTFGHLAYRVDDIYATCQRLMDAGHTIACHSMNHVVQPSLHLTRWEPDQFGDSVALRNLCTSGVQR